MSGRTGCLGCVGCFAMGLVLLFSAASLTIHGFTVWYAFMASGVGAAGLTFILPVASELFWARIIAEQAGTWWNWYTVALIGWAVSGMGANGLMMLLARSTDTQSSNLDIDLDQVATEYLSSWPNWNEEYRFFKPDSLLPADKNIIAMALRREYEYWPEAIDWVVFNSFFTEYVDLALFLGDEEFQLLEKFRNMTPLRNGSPLKRALSPAWIPLSAAASMADVSKCDKMLGEVMAEVQRSEHWDPQEASDAEIARLREILIACISEYKTLCIEWREFIVSIGKDTYIK